LASSPVANAAACPPIQNKPGAIPHVQYDGVRHLTYCYGPVSVKPGQNIIRLNPTDLFPNEPGYITRFDPELVYGDGTVPRVDVLHLHHAVWVVNGNPQFATGEEKTIIQAPKGFGWRSLPTDNWLLNDMLHELVGTPATVYIVWRIDFVPDTALPADCTPFVTGCIRKVSTRWMDVSGPSPRVGISSPIYPVFNARRGMGDAGRYTFPDQGTVQQRRLIGPSQHWTPDHPVTLISTVGHLHPGGLSTGLRVGRDGTRNTLFTSRANYYEPAGAVSWDVAMGATPSNWRVKLQAGDNLSVHATYDVERADWYEVMGIMPVAVYDGNDVGGVGAFSSEIPKNGVLTHGHLAENRNHGGAATELPDPRTLPGVAPLNPIGIEEYEYEQGDLNQIGNPNPPRINFGQSLTFLNHDAEPAENVFHTLTSCRAPCNRSTGIAYPIANGPRSFDSGQLGFNYAGFGAPAADRDTWSTPKTLKPGTYTYFCRVHPFMRGSFRVVDGG
jgi:plastocyanin